MYISETVNFLRKVYVIFRSSSNAAGLFCEINMLVFRRARHSGPYFILASYTC